MATETRTIIFDQSELRQAAAAYCIRKCIKVPSAQLSSVLAEQEDIGIVRLKFSGQDRSKTEVTLSYSQMAAAIIQYCGVVGVPLPRFSRKYLAPAGDGIALHIRLPEYVGEAIEAPYQLQNGASILNAIANEAGL